MRKKRLLAGISLSGVAIFLLITALLWVPFLLPRFSDGFDPGSGGVSSFGVDHDIMEGRMALPSIAWNSAEGEVSGDTFSPEDLDPEWEDIIIRSDGIHGPSGDLLFSSEELTFEQEGLSFPSGGVERRDYVVFNRYLGRDVTASYSGISEVMGKTGFVYSMDIEREEIAGLDMLSRFLTGGKGTIEGDPSSFLEGTSTRFTYSDSTRYVLDPRTSIPLDIQTDIEVGMKLPDTTILTVRENDIRYADEEVWVESETVPGTKEKIEVLVVTRTTGRLDPEDVSIGLYDREVTYYDKKTGEVISTGGPEEKETFAVDRSTYRYIPGHYGTRRSGYFEFPVGKVERRSYPMWDEFSGMENEASYSGDERRWNLDVMVFEMVTEDVVVESGNALLPIYPHPATEYLLDTVQRWYIDERTGFMVDFHIEGTVKVASSGPLSLIETEVTTFEVTLPENTTDELREVADLFHELVIPLSNREIVAFGLEISFTDGTIRELIDIANMVGRIMDITQLWVPRVLLISAALVSGVSIFLFYLSRKPSSVYSEDRYLSIELS